MDFCVTTARMTALYNCQSPQCNPRLLILSLSVLGASSQDAPLREPSIVTEAPPGLSHDPSAAWSVWSQYYGFGAYVMNLQAAPGVLTKRRSASPAWSSTTASWSPTTKCGQEPATAATAAAAGGFGADLHYGAAASRRLCLHPCLCCMHLGAAPHWQPHCPPCLDRQACEAGPRRHQSCCCGEAGQGIHPSAAAAARARAWPGAGWRAGCGAQPRAGAEAGVRAGAAWGGAACQECSGCFLQCTLADIRTSQSLQVSSYQCWQHV